MKSLTLFLAFLNFFPMSAPARQDRLPAVAGQFYPSDKTELQSALKGMFARAAAGHGGARALVVPHAGYIFSGEVAASGFNQIDTSRPIDNVFLIGTSHHVAFDGVSLYASGNFVTPLGTVQVNRDLARTLKGKSDIFGNREDVHAQEHSLEVELPFLQYLFGRKLRIVPMLFGTDSPETCRQAADVLRPYFTPNNLFVVSTDFSHYPQYDDAVSVDRATADAVLSNSPEKLLQSIKATMAGRTPNLATSLCGLPGVLTLLYLTSGVPGLSYREVQYRNSGDLREAGRSRVVGYFSLVVEQKEKNRGSEFNLDDRDKRDLLALARMTIERYIGDGRLPGVDATRFSSRARTPCGAFVTLHKRGELRGCIGRFESAEPLYKVVQEMSVAAATEDSRFPPVQAGEIAQLELEISALSPMRRIASIDEIELGRHGIYIRKGNRGGTFLPQVAAETGWSKEEFLGHCARDKAGIGWDGWKDADIFVYEALVFSERDLRR